MRTIDAARILRSSAWKRTFIISYCIGMPSGPEKVRELLSPDAPILKNPGMMEIRDKACKMTDEALLSRANGILIDHFNSGRTRELSGLETPPTLRDFIEKRFQMNFHAMQFLIELSMKMQGKEMDFNKPDLDPEARKAALQGMQDLYEQFLLFTLALEKMSEEHDFMPSAKEYYLREFVAMDGTFRIGALVNIDELFSDHGIEDAVKIAKLLLLIARDLKAPVSEVMLLNRFTNDNFAVTTSSGTVQINLSALPELDISLEAMLGAGRKKIIDRIALNIY